MVFQSQEKIDTFSYHLELIRAAPIVYLELLNGRNVFYVKDEHSKFKTETPELRGDQYRERGRSFDS